MEINDTKILEAVENVDVKAPASLREAADMLTGANRVSAGSKVAILEDPTYPFAGQRGTVKGPSAKGSGYVDVEMANKTVVPLQVSLLVPLA